MEIQQIKMENILETNVFSAVEGCTISENIPKVITSLFKKISKEYFVNWYRIKINYISNEIVVTIYGDGIKK